MRKMTYEAGLEELSGIIDQIEKGTLTLEETLKAYEKGNVLLEKLSGMLEEGKGRVLKLMPDGTQAPMDQTEEDEE